MNHAWLLDLKTYLEIISLAEKHGKKAGDSMQEEFNEIMKKHSEKIKSLGAINKDVDLLTGDLREEGFNILNLNELDRRKENER